MKAHLVIAAAWLLVACGDVETVTEPAATRQAISQEQQASGGQQDPLPAGMLVEPALEGRPVVAPDIAADILGKQAKYLEAWRAQRAQWEQAGLSEEEMESRRAQLKSSILGEGGTP